MAKYRLKRQKVFALSFNPIKNFGTAFNSTAGTGARIGAGLAGMAQVGGAALAAGC